MAQRIFIPGSEWLYFKIYTGNKTGDDILRDQIYPFAETLLQKGVIQDYFFIRYSDPQFHIRLRLWIKEVALYGEVFSLFHRMFQPLLENQRVSRIVSDTYTRELERYGDNTIETAERIFGIDSRTILSLLKAMEEYDTIHRETSRWQLSLLLIDDTLDAFGYTLEEKISCMTEMAKAYKHEFGFVSNTFTKQLNDKYRNQRKTIETVLKREWNEYPIFQPALQQRKELLNSYWNKIRTTFQQPGSTPNKESFTRSIIHMTLNRLFKSKNRVHELVIYDMLPRYHQSELAKQTYSKK